MKKKFVMNGRMNERRTYGWTDRRVGRNSDVDVELTTVLQKNVLNSAVNLNL